MKLVTPKFAWAVFWGGTSSEATPGVDYDSPMVARAHAAAACHKHPSVFDARPMSAPAVSGTIDAPRGGHRK